MKLAFLVALLAVGLKSLDGWLDHLNAWTELGLKVAGLAAAFGAAWRWMIGPGYRRAKAAVVWVGSQLELIGHLDDRLDSIDERLDRGEVRFCRIDQALEALASEEAAVVRRALREGRPVAMRPDDPTAVERRG